VREDTEVLLWVALLCLVSMLIVPALVAAWSLR
jgi:hypothetical protein